MTTLRTAAQQALTYEQFCSQPLAYVMGVTGDWGARRLYRNNKLGIQYEVLTKRKRHGDIYGGWRKGKVTCFLDGDPREFANSAELYVAWMARVYGVKEDS